MNGLPTKQLPYSAWLFGRQTIRQHATARPARALHKKCSVRGTRRRIMFTWIAVLALVLWFWSGWQKLEVGWKGQRLFLGKRIPSSVVDEGWQWAASPLSIKAADCRQVVLKLEPLEAITQDNVVVNIDGSIVRKVVDLNQYFGVNPDELKQGLDDIWDEIIRSKVRTKDLQEVLTMQVALGDHAKTHLCGHAAHMWGIDILKVVVASIKPNVEVTKDLENVERENLQRNAQAVELKHFTERVLELMKEPKDGGPGLTREQAIEQVQMTMGQLKKEAKAQTIALDPATAALVAAIIAKGKK